MESPAAFSTFRDARVLITGGAGFIGSNLAHRLVDLGAQVTLVDSLIPQYGGNLANLEGFRQRLAFHISDVRDPYAMSYLIQGQDFLFNMAGQTSHLDSMQDPMTDLHINATAQLSILEAARKHNPGLRTVFASTRQVYGRPSYLPVDEAHPIHPVDINGIHKVAGEEYHLLYSQVYGMRCSALRLTNTYGPGMRVRDARQTFLGIWVNQVLHGQTIRVYGDGTQLRDFNYVDDAVDAFLHAALAPEAQGRVMNLGSPEVVSLADLAKLVCEVNGSGTWELVPFPPDRKAIDIGDYYSDHRLAGRILGWEPLVGLREGLARTLAYYRRHGASYWEATP